MAKYSNVVQYNIVTDVDTSGIVKLQNELTKLKQSLKFDKSSFSQLGFDDAKIEQSIKKVNQLQSAITAAFNPKIGTLDLSKLNASLQKEHTSLQMIVKDWEQMGTRGTMAISNLSNALLSMNKGAMNVNTTLSKIANTFGNTVRWGITASIFQEMMSSVQGAVSYMKDLDESLTQIQMVTNSSKEDMRELAQYANNAAQALGSTTTDYTNAVKVFVQEGFSESESKQYADLSIKLANVSEQDTATTSDQITAFRNAFQLDFEQTVAAMDKVANVANNTASNVNELMTASQRAASVAQAVGASQDSFLASIATIESVTRQSAEEIGNGLKTIYQRFADIKAGGTAEDGVDYGQYANALRSIGVDVLDAAGEFKGMDQILKETQEVWSSLSDTMKIAVGEKVAGKFQYNRFAALMNNPEYYEKALTATGSGAEGMMDQMNNIYMESIEGRLNTLQAAGEQVMSTLFNQDAVEPMIEDVTELVNGLNSLVEAMGGLNGVLPAISALMLRTFSTQIAGTITNIANSIGTIVANSSNANQLSTAVNLVGLNNYAQTQGSSVAGKLVSNVADNYDQLSIGTQEKIRDLSQQIIELEQQKTNVLREQEQFFKQITENALEEQMLQEQKLETQEKILEQKYKEGKLTEEQYQSQKWILEDDMTRLGVYDKLAKETREYATQIANGSKANAEMVARLREMRREAAGLGINIAELESLMEQLDIATNNLRIGEKMTEAVVETVNLEANINNVVKGLSSLTSIAFGVSMLGETFKTLGDESTSLKEKLDAVAMNGLMGITMLVPGIMQGITVVRELSKAWEAWKVQQAAAIAIEELWTDKQALNISLRRNTTKEIALECMEQGKLNKEKMTARLIEAGYTETMAKGIATKTANLAIDEASNKVTTGQIVKTTLRTQVTNTLTAALVRLGIAEKTTTAAAGPVGWAILAIGAAVTVATIGLNQMAEAEEKRRQQLEEEINTSNQIIQKLDETKSAYDEVYSNYKRTGEASEDLKNKSLELAEALKIEGAEALANAGRYDELNEKIQQASLNQREYNNALLEQQAEDLNKQNSTYYYNWQNMAYGADGSLVGTGPTSASVTSGEERIKAKKSAIETAEKEIAAAREQLALLDNTKDGYIEEKAALEELIKTKQTYIAQIALTENEEKQVEVYKSAAENTANIFKDSGLFDNITNYQEVIDELQSNEDIKKYLSLLGEEEARAWIQAYTQEILINKPNILEAYQEALANENAAINAYNNNENLREALSVENINSLQDFSKAIEDGRINVEGLAEKIDELVGKTEDLTTNINGNTFTNRIDISSDEDAMKKLLDDSGMSEGAFSRMSREAYEDESGYYQQEEQYLERAKQRLEEVIEAKEKDGKTTQQETEELAELNSKINGLDVAAKDTTAAILRMSNGVVKLRGKIEDISEVLTNDAFQGTTEWYQALNDLDEGLSEVLNIDAGTLSDTFIESGEALDYARRMAEGDMSAIDDLREAAAQDIVQNLAIQAKPGEDVDVIRAELMAELNQLQADINSGAITVTTDLDTNLFVQKLNEMLEAGQISAEQASNILSSIGMDAQIKHAQGTGKMSAVEYEVQVDYIEAAGPTPDGPGWNIPKIRMVPSITQVDAPIDIPYLEGTHYTGSGVQTANTAARNPSYTGGYSGNPSPKSSSSPKKSGSNKQPKNNQKKDKQKSEWDYLTNITNDLERQAAIIEKLSKLEDRLYGANRVKQLKTLQAEYKKNLKLLQQEEKIAKRHAERLRTRAKDENGNLTINGYAYRAGIKKLQFDGQGNLDNGRQIEQALLAKVNQAIKDYNKHRNDEDTGQWQWNLDNAKSDYDGFLKAMSDYESTLGKIEDAQSQIQEQKEQIQDAADAIVDSIQEGIEDVVKAMDNQREFNRMYRNWQEGGNSYSHFGSNRQYYAEGLANILSPTINGKSIFDTQLESLDNRIKDVQDVFDINPETGKREDDKKEADDEKLSQQAAFENLQQSTEDIMKSLNDMIDYYDSLIETIKEASDKMDELIDNRLEEFDRLENYLDTRLDQLQLLFGDRSYEQQADFYQQKIVVNTEKMNSIMTAIEQEQIKVKTLENMEATNKELSSEERQELQDARDKVNELQEEQLNTETKLLQDISNKLKAQTSAEMDKLISSLFNGADVDWLSQQWEIATRNSEKYFDDYNRAFELQKLQLKFQEALNDNQNASLATQQKIAALGDEYLTYLREKNKLSEYDVKHAQMQLDILQKQIALEDARNNKSQMRLQRNAAGNYDFVYAADEDAVNKATEALIQAQQDSYNLSKQMRLETYEAAFEAALKTKDLIVSIAEDASIAVEEKKERVQEILNSLIEYLDGSYVELNEVSINLYNDFVGATELVAQENEGNLTAIFEQMRAESALLHEEISASMTNVQGTLSTTSEDSIGIISGTVSDIEKIIAASSGNIQNSINGENGLQGILSSSFNQISEDGSAAFNTMFENIANGDGSHLGRIRVGTIDTADEISKYITNTTLPSIDKRFEISQTNALSKTADIDSEIKKTIDNISGPDGYLESFEASVKDALKLAGDSWQTFTEDSIRYSGEQLELLKEKTQDWQNDLTNLNQEISDCADEVSFWKKQIDQALASTAGLITKSTELQKKLGGLATQAGTTAGKIEDVASAADYAADAQYNAADAAYELASGASSAAQEASNAAGAYRDMAAAAAYAAAAAANSGSWAVADANGVGKTYYGFSSEQEAKNWAKKYGYDNNNIFYSSGGGKFDTGGYTGTWTDSGIDEKHGKLAILHQKELVLNATDTKNMLSAVEVVRDIMSGINSLPSLGKALAQSNYNNTTEQRVEINASFPGVTTALEIERALTELADNAYQYANKY